MTDQSASMNPTAKAIIAFVAAIMAVTFVGLLFEAALTEFGYEYDFNFYELAVFYLLWFHVKSEVSA